MFIHIGNNNVIRSRKIVSILDFSIIASSSIMEEMIQEKKKRKKIKGPLSSAKSVVITNDLIYYSSLSVPTLKKRSGFNSVIKKFENYYKEEL